MSRAAHLLFALVLSAVVSGESAEPKSPDAAEVSRAMGPGYEISWRATKKRLENAPQWDARSEPPLSVGEAIRVARRHLDASRSTAAQAAVKELALAQAHSAADDYLPSEQRPVYFVYRIEFEAPSGPLWKPERYVIVLLDGSVVTPKLTFR